MTQEESVRRLAEIRERADKATPGPWECEHEDYVSSVYLGSANAGSYPAQRAPIHRDTDITDRQADEARSTVEFIAHSREDVPYLLDLIDSLTAERDRLALWIGEAIEGKFGVLVATGFADLVACTHTRAEAAEADRERLREALMVCFDAFDQRYDGAPDSRAQWMVEPMEAARAALATPPSEGEQS